MKDWFCIKKYSHLGLPFTMRDKSWIISYVSNPKNIIKHSFSPLIRKIILEKRYRKDYSSDTTKRQHKNKKREICYATHIDSCIYRYYASRLQKKYEAELKIRNLNDCITAYRSIPIDPENPQKGNKCNIHFANDIFKYIRNRTGENITVLTFDITNFFNNLDHRIIKKT